MRAGSVNIGTEIGDGSMRTKLTWRGALGAGDRLITYVWLLGFWVIGGVCFLEAG